MASRFTGGGKQKTSEPASSAKVAGDKGVGALSAQAAKAGFSETSIGGRATQLAAEAAVARSKSAEASLAAVVGPVAMGPVDRGHMLMQFAYEPKNDTEWHPRHHARVKANTQPLLEIAVTGHEESDGHTWYSLACAVWRPSIDFGRCEWVVYRRLRHLKEGLHEVVKSSIDAEAYSKHFGGSPFASMGGMPGTTGRLRGWCQALARAVNAGALPPAVVASTLRLLEAPAKDPAAVALARSCALEIEGGEAASGGSGHAVFGSPRSSPAINSAPPAAEAASDPAPSPSPAFAPPSRKMLGAVGSAAVVSAAAAAAAAAPRVSAPSGESGSSAVAQRRNSASTVRAGMESGRLRAEAVVAPVGAAFLPRVSESSRGVAGQASPVDDSIALDFADAGGASGSASPSGTMRAAPVVEVRENVTDSESSSEEEEVEAFQAIQETSKEQADAEEEAKDEKNEAEQEAEARVPDEVAKEAAVAEFRKNEEAEREAEARAAEQAAKEAEEELRRQKEEAAAKEAEEEERRKKEEAEREAEARAAEQAAKEAEEEETRKKEEAVAKVAEEEERRKKEEAAREAEARAAEQAAKEAEEEEKRKKEEAAAKEAEEEERRKKEEAAREAEARAAEQAAKEEEEEEKRKKEEAAREAEARAEEQAAKEAEEKERRKKEESEGLADAQAAEQAAKEEEEEERRQQEEARRETEEVARSKADEAEERQAEAQDATDGEAEEDAEQALKDPHVSEPASELAHPPGEESAIEPDDGAAKAAAHSE